MRFAVYVPCYGETYGDPAVLCSLAVEVGPMITPVPRWRPWKVALEASTLQRSSGGRLVLGVGMGVPRGYTSFGAATWLLLDGWKASLDELRSYVSAGPPR